jgi:hypothetical protein
MTGHYSCIPMHAGAGWSMLSIRVACIRKTEQRDGSLVACVLCGDVFHGLFEVLEFEMRVDLGGV